MLDRLKNLWDSNERALVTYRERFVSAIRREEDAAFWLDQPDLLRLRMTPKDMSQLRSVTVPEALKSFRHLLIIGGPGSGKTTLLKYIAVASASGNTTDLPNLPILVPVSSYNAGSFFQALNERFSQIAATTLPHEDMTRLIGQGRFLVLVDGLDENSSPAQVARDISVFLARYPNTPMIVAARETTRHVLDGFAIGRVAPLEERDIRHLSFHLCSKYRVDSQRLWQQLRGNSNLRSLAQNPLLLRVIVQTYQAHGDLQLSTSALLEHWLSLQRKSTPEIARKEADDYAAVIAIHLVKLGRSAFDRSEVSKAFEEGSAGESSVDKALVMLCDQGIVVNETATEYRFTHRIFQEFFASRALTRMDPKDVLAFVKDRETLSRTVALIPFLADAENSDGIISQLAASQEPEFKLCAANLILEGAKTSSTTYNMALRRLIGLLDEPTTKLGWRTCDALVRLNDISVTEYCQRELAHQSANSKSANYAAYILSMKGESDSRILELLFRAARDKDAALRVQALRALFSTQSEVSLAFIVDRLKEEDEETVVEEILTGLEVIADLVERAPASTRSALIAELERRLQSRHTSLHERMRELKDALTSTSIEVKAK